MTTFTDKHIPVDLLAQRVVNDIAARGLRPGDRYLTAEEARQQFGVRKAAIEATFRKLSHREVLVRRQRAGTFIGPGSRDASTATGLQRVIVLFGRRRRAYLSADDLMQALWRRLPGAAVQFVHLQGEHDASYLRELIEQTARAGERVGFIAVSCSRGVYEVLAGSRLPTVVMGSVDPQYEARLTSIDADAAQAGRLLVNYLLERGKSRIAVVMDETWRIGDNHFYEAIRSVMSDRGLPVDGLRVISLPPDKVSIDRYVASCYADGAGPDAFISRPGRVGTVWVPMLIADAAAAQGRSVPDDVAVVYHLDRDLTGEPPPPFPCTYRTWSWDHTFEHVTAFLVSMEKSREAPREHVLMGVALRDPAAD